MKWSILCYCISGGQERLNELEIHFIKERNSLAPNGYNLTTGGKAGGRASEETKKVQSESAKKKYENPDVRHKMRETKIQFCIDNPDKIIKGENHYMFGKTGEQHHSSKKIHQYSKDGKTFIKEWACAGDVYRENQIQAYNISSVCNGNRLSAGGFFWRHAPTE